MSGALYSNKILSHYRHPQHYGLRDGFDVEVRHSNSLCGDVVTVRLRFDADRVADVCFESAGCVLSRAAASLMGDAVVGQEIATVRAMGFETVQNLLGITLTPARIGCAMLFLEAVCKARYNGNP